MTTVKPQFDPQELAAVEAIDRFAREQLAPNAAALDEAGEFAFRHHQAMAELGLYGLNIPPEYGGIGLSPAALFLAVSHITAACASTASLITAHFLAADAIAIAGDRDQRQRLLPRLAAGSLAAFALTEPAAGSNPADLTTRAELVAAGYRISGSKQFISNADAAEILVVFAKTDPAAGARGISVFAVDRSTAGVAIGRAERTMGLKGGHVFPISLDCVVPQSARLGAEGSGFKTAMRVLDNGRLEVAAMAIGIAEAALAAAVAYAKSRRVGAGMVADFQGIQWMLADMACDLAAARAVAAEATALRTAGQPFSVQSAMAKLIASEMAGRVTDKALQVHGGYGFTRDLPLERYVRDARILRIYEGSSEIQRNIIARALLG